jgi:hypothetical protein
VEDLYLLKEERNHKLRLLAGATNMFKRMCMDLYPKCIYSGGYNIILGQRAFTNTEIFTYNRLLNPGNVLRKVL